MSHNYKFYLSFENGNCRGYVSEKLPKAFIWNLVPVIAGPVDWHAHVPNLLCTLTSTAPLLRGVSLWMMWHEPSTSKRTFLANSLVSSSHFVSNGIPIGVAAALGWVPSVLLITLACPVAI